MLKTNWTHIKYKTQAELFGSACVLTGKTEEKGCRLSSFECEDERVYNDVNDRSPNHEERALDAPLSSVWYSLRESNPQLALRRGLLYPFN